MKRDRKPLGAGKAGEKRGRGIAVHESFDTVMANVAEVTVGPDGSVKIDRVVCAPAGASVRLRRFP